MNVETIGVTKWQLNMIKATLNKKHHVLSNIYLKPGYIIVTNGKRLIVITAKNITQTGVFSILNAEKIATSVYQLIVKHEPDIQYPDYKSVLRSNEPKIQNVELNETSLDLTAAVIKLYRDTKRSIDISQLEALVNEQYSVTWDVYGAEGEEKPLFFVITDVEVVILPFRLAKERN